MIFSVGELVKMKVTGDKAQIVRLATKEDYPYSDYYVRLSDYRVLAVKEFEIEGME